MENFKHKYPQLTLANKPSRPFSFPREDAPKES